MLDLFEQAETWLKTGKQVACATVISTFGSSPYPPGAKMFITASGEMAGSVSGGCVESTIAQTAGDVLKEAKPRLMEFGVTKEQAAEIGLACGGTMQVFLEPVPPLLSLPAGENSFQQILQCLRNRQSAVAATIVSGAGLGKKWFYQPAHPLPEEHEQPAVLETITSALNQVWKKQQSALIQVQTGSEVREVFLDSYTPPPRLIIIGAVHIAIPLVSMAKMVGFYTIVIDARAVFATRERFPHADELIRAYPPDALHQLTLDEASYVVTLTHDEKFDNPSLEEALKYPVRYIGALGSKRTHQQRLETLQQSGLTKEQLCRIHAPVGLNLGGRTPGEIAAEILAEIIAVRRGMST